MPSTVTCPACASPFTLSDDLLQRKVAGNLMTVKCRHCSAEIALDVTDTSVDVSHDPARRAPALPRRRAVTQLGLGPAPATARLVGKSATDTPLGSAATGTPLPLNATATPSPGNTIVIPRGLGTVPKTVKIEALPIWDDSEETVQINAPKLPPADPTPKLSAVRHLPRVPHPPRKVREEEPELIEAEEIPPSSADAPTLDPPQLEAAAATPPSTEPIDVDFDFVEEKAQEEKAEPGELRTDRGERARTMPLFDMSAVLPVASDAVRPSEASAARAQASDSPVSVSGRAPESKARGRKFVVAPESPAAEPEAAAATMAAPKGKRAGTLLWFGLVAAASGVVAIVGMRGHQSEAPVVKDSSVVPSGEPAPSEATVAAPAEPSAQEVANVPPSAPLPVDSAPAAAPARTTTTLAVVNAPTPASGGGSPKPTPTLEKPELAAPAATSATSATSATAALEQPTEPSKPLEAHNAPPPAPEGTEFDRAAARNALASAAAQASACRKDGDPSGTATIVITFAPSGRVTSANLQGPPFAGTATGGCIANTMRHATVPAFSGERVTVTKAIVVQ